MKNSCEIVKLVKNSEILKMSKTSSSITVIREENNKNKKNIIINSNSLYICILKGYTTKTTMKHFTLQFT